jgi:16S rRNA (cytosine1402-N4)-methyltransferase
MTAASASEEGFGHEPVMVDEVLRYLDPRGGSRVLDLTVGAGGHARAILDRIGQTGLLVGVDRDGELLQRTASRLRKDYPQTRFLHANFGEIDELAGHLSPITFGGVLLDLGVSSEQLDDAGRGFSFARTGPIDMRMDRSRGAPASGLLKTASADELERVLREYSEERFARRIARAIVRERARTPLVDTHQLADLVERVVPARPGGIHAATRTFQALRIAVNDELGNLSRCLAEVFRLLDIGGVIVVISFHSLEDRLVKGSFRQGKTEGRLEVLTPKPVRPGEEEVRLNRRARSARLRAARLIRTTGQ